MVDTAQRLPVVHGTGGAPAYSDKVRRKILAGLKLGWTRTAAYGAAGVSESTFYRWLEEDGSFREDVKQAEAIAEGAYTTDLRRGSRAGNVKAASFWLERRRPREWRNRTEITIRERTLEDDLDEMDEATLRELLEDVRRGRTPGAGSEDRAGAAAETGP